MYYSTKEMEKKKKKKTCLPGYENFSMLGETNNQFSMTLTKNILYNTPFALKSFQQ
jgi:hypothetical protein